MVAVPSAPSFNNDFPLNSTSYPNRRVRDEVADKVVGAAPGATATVTRTRLAHNSQHQGRQVPEVVTEINRATTASDVTNIKKEVKTENRSLVFARDLSGNGGPAFSKT
jgi:hypothetical protein